MKAKIAVATVSGRSYYKLVSMLKTKNVPFISLKPWEDIPLNIKAVITTKGERHLVTHHNVLTFEDESDPASVIDRAMLAVQGKRSYEKFVVGVDPGKTFGVAVLVDGSVLETLSCSSLEETVSTILDFLGLVPATACSVKVGDGAPEYGKELLNLLDKALPQGTIIEVVNEVGTSLLQNEATHRRESKDAMSAIEIAGRKGRIFARAPRKRAH